MTKTIGIALFVATLGIGGTLYADDQVDCSKIPQKEGNKQYSKGDIVKDFVTTGMWEFRCASSDCTRSATSAYSNYPWERVAKCK